MTLIVGFEIAPSVEAVPSCVNAGNVTGLGSDGCNLGPLNFSSFRVSAAGVTANLADIMLFYTAKTLSGLAQIGGVDLVNPGRNVTIRETVCATPFQEGQCRSGVVADYVVAGGGTPASATFDPLSTIYVLKDIQLLRDSFISEFVNSHDEPPVATPEPATMLLLGSGLAAAGLAARRRARKIATPAESQIGSGLELRPPHAPAGGRRCGCRNSRPDS